MNVSEQLLEILKQEGVKHIFGVAGDALNPLVSAIGNQDQIKWVKMKHEGNASFAAFAQGELGDNFGVCASTVGPGALHLINGLYNAKKERSPVVAITGQIPTEYLGTNYHQEVNLTKIFDDICEYQAVIRSPEEAPKVILRAIRIAVNYKAVCRIELPADIAELPAANQDFLQKSFRSNSKITAEIKVLEEAAELINQAKKVGILAGVGCRNSKEEVIKFSKLLNAPITHTVKASDIFDHSTENVVGLTGLIGNPSGYKAVMDCDLLIMLGTDFPYSEYLPHGTKTIQIDIRPENIGNRTSVDLGIHSDIKDALEYLNEKCKLKRDPQWVNALNKDFKKWIKHNGKISSSESDFKVLHPQVVAKEISDKASKDAVFVIDTGTSAIWASNFMNFHSERRLIGAFNHGSMAVGIPAAIGAQIQFPNREIWALVGDGAFHMTLHDFSTAVEYGLPIKIIVLSNEELGFVKIEMEEAGLSPNYDALEVKNFDFAAFADLVGGHGIKLEDTNNVEQAILEASQSSKPVIVDARVNGGELSLPPNINFEMAKNFAFSKIKEGLRAAKGDQKNWENIKNELLSFIDKELN
ncbi:thiamine pyrophosphate-binding protein [Marivirga arenosa]|uniref:Thiamine pyrophosphate-binding protein n=1 Tax=Marivirga arenosa TaxID=3059076 RepID=A0AA51R9L4_9BACT|nr:thiamine pyrophosphate-dependent enzyme [Marivirga sp. ABR2-2]WMN07746.1 thiamine pyrophosphate-binding protein [Marivirga sp. ABR2-2]